MSDLGSPGGGEGGRSGVWGRRGHLLWSTAVRLGFEGRAEGSGVRASELFAKLSGGRGEGRCASLQAGGSEPGAQAGGGRVRANAQRAAVLWGAPRAFGGSVYKSKQAPKLISALGILPSRRFQAFLQEPGDGQCKLHAGWIVQAMFSPPLAIFTLHFGVWSVCACGGGDGGGTQLLPPFLK